MGDYFLDPKNAEGWRKRYGTSLSTAERTSKVAFVLSVVSGLVLVLSILYLIFRPAYSSLILFWGCIAVCVGISYLKRRLVDRADASVTVCRIFVETHEKHLKEGK